MKTKYQGSRSTVNGKLRLFSLTAAALLAFGGAAFAFDAGTLPTGGQITAGSGSIGQAGSQMTIDQTSQQMIASWSTFNIGQDAAVRFNQPNGSAVALNRIQDQNPSQILGALSANGQVYLLNPAGILFGLTAQVDVGGLVASSLDLTDEDFLAGKSLFATTGTAGAVVNQGSIRTADGGYVAFLAPHVGNAGSIEAANGTVALAAGDRVSLDFTGDRLVTFTVEQGAIDALAENHGLIRADGGLVMMTAAAADQLTGAVVNNDGVIQARTLENRDGRILLLADMETGTTTVSGTLDASAPEGGDGGFIETSAAQVKVTDDAHVTTLAATGKTGEWLIDPTNFTIMTGGDLSPATLAAALNAGNVVIQTADEGSSMGHIYIMDPISWSSANDLALNAHGDITSYAPITNNAGGSLVLRADSDGNGSGSLYFGGGVSISLTGGGRADLYYHPYDPTTGIPTSYAAPTDFSAVMGSTPYTAWMLVNDITQLQAMSTNLSGAYALGRDIDATATATWNSGAGFAPVGSPSSYFTGQFDGLGHTISGLTINRPAQDYVGLFGAISGSSAAVRKVSLLNGSVGGNAVTGGLVGLLNSGGSVIDSHLSGTVTGSDTVGGLVGSAASGSLISGSHAAGMVNGRDFVGGLAGRNDGTISDSHAEGSVSGSYDVGGLVGFNPWGTISNAYATGSVSASFISGSSGTYHTGGLVGYNYGSLDNVHATGAINGQDYVGGLVGASANSISNAYAEGAVTGRDYVGGLAGYSYYSGGIDSVHATGTVIGRDYVGGLVGATQGRSVTNAYAEGAVSGNNYVGGLVGYSELGGVIGSVYATGDVSGVERVGGLIGHTKIDVSNSYATGNVQSTGTYAGGLVGINDAWVSNSYATGNVSGGNNVGGLAGHSNYGGMNQVYATGSVNGNEVIGGLAGSNFGTVTDAYAIGSVTGNRYAGGLAGYNNNYGTLNRTYASGLVTLNPDGSYAGGLAGWTYPGSVIANSYWDIQTTGQTSAIGLNLAGNTATGLTIAEMMQQASFAPFDFSSIWRIYEGKSYPVLRSLQQPLLTVTASNDSKIYDGLAYSGGNGVTYSVAGAAPTGLLTYGGAAQGAVNAGSYTIIPQIAMTQQDYQNWAEVTFNDGILTVDPASLIVTASSAVKTYDGLAYSGGNGVTYDGFVRLADYSKLEGELIYGGNSQGAVGTGSYVITPSGISVPNYSITFKDGPLTVNPAPLTVTADDKSRTYGDANPTLTATYTGLQGTDTATVVSGLTLDTTATTGSNVGSYAITTADGTAANYTLTFVGGILTVTPAPLTVTADDKSRTYGDANPTLTATYSGLQGTDTAAVVGGLTLNTTATTGSNVGSYTITAADGTAANYTLTFVDGILTVTPAPLTVTIDDKSRIYGNANPTLTATYTGLQGTDTAAVVGGLTLDTTATTGSNVGSYAITAADGTAINYTITFVDGILTVTPAPLTVTANHDSKTYDGREYSGGKGVVFDGFVAGEDETVLGGTLSYAGTSQGALIPGDYTISPEGLVSTNYTIRFVDGRLVIESLVSPMENSTSFIDNIVASLTSPQDAINGTLRDPIDGLSDPASLQARMGPGTGSGTLDAFVASPLVRIYPCVDSLRDTVFCQ